MNELRTDHTNDEAVEIARKWMTENYGAPRDMDRESRNSYHEKLGLLVDFISTLCPQEPEKP